MWTKFKAWVADNDVRLSAVGIGVLLVVGARIVGVAPGWIVLGIAGLAYVLGRFWAIL